MFKKNKKEYENCNKCGKPLSKSEIKNGVSKCENCLGKQAKKTIEEILSMNLDNHKIFTDDRRGINGPYRYIQK